CLSLGARIAIQDKTSLRVGLCNTVFHHSRSQIVRYKYTGVQNFAKFFTQGAFLLNDRPENVSRADLGDVEYIGQTCGLCAFACTLDSHKQKNTTHGMPYLFSPEYYKGGFDARPY